jgi:hypothetical protein
VALRMDLSGPTALVGTRTDYSVGPWDCSTYLCHTAPNGVGRKDYGGEVLGQEAIHVLYYVDNS